MSRWTHSACSDCFQERYPDKTPHRVTPSPHAKAAICCVCGITTFEGIYIRADPDTMKYCEHTEE